MYREAVAWALSSCDHIDGMMQFERKYAESQIANIDGIDIILRYAPVLFDSTSLDKLDSLLKGQRRIAKNSSDDLIGKLAAARNSLWHAHRVWNEIERGPTPPDGSLGEISAQGTDAEVVGAWERMGVLRRQHDGGTYRLVFSTQLQRTVFAKCPACGSVVAGPKSSLLSEAKCPKCSATVAFVILATET